MNNKLNLIFDFSNMAMRALFICTYANKGEISTFDRDEECNILIRKIAMDMAYVMRMFTSDRVIIACDARHPWRNDLYSEIENESYKGNRQKDTTKNWDKIFKSLNEFKEILKDRGFIVTELDTAEADDVSALWKEKLFENGENLIMVSSDKDWKQLIDFVPASDKFCLCFNPIANNRGKKLLSGTKEFFEWLKTDNSKTDIFFSNYNPWKDKLKNIKSYDSKIEFEEINPQQVVLDKIMCGDDGDNAPSFCEYYKNGKKIRMTPAKCKKVLQSLNVETVKDLCQCTAANALLKTLNETFKHEFDDFEPNERLMRQRKLVELNSNLFPQLIKDSFDKHSKNYADKGKITTAGITLEYILKDSKFLEEKQEHHSRENSIFDNIKDLDKYIKPVNSTSLF